jgi:hypothetical protein
MARLLLLLLTELLHELLDLPTLLCDVAPGVVHRAPRTALVTAKGVPWPLVASWAMTPTSRYSGSGRSSQWLVVVVVAGLLLPISISVVALSSGICFRLDGLSCL